VELHERWLAELHSESMKHKLALAEGRITNEEYMENVNWHNHNNINRRYGAVGRERQFVEAGKLIKNKEKILVLVPHGTSEELNANSIRFWNLQDVLLNAVYQEDPDSADLKDPHYVLMDPTFDELRNPTGLIQKEITKADIVLYLNMYEQWVVMKTPHQELDNRYLWILEIPAVKLDDLFVNNPKEVWVYIDHRLGYTNECENLYHAFAEHLTKIKPDVILHLMSGHPTAEWMREQEIVLMADRFGFFVKHAPQTPHIATVVPFNELVGPDSKIHQHLYFGDSTLTSRCRTEFSREVKPLSPDNDPGQFYTQGIKPLMPYEAPGYGYALSAEAEEARVQLTQKELTRMSLSRFGFVLVDPDTGLTLSKEEQDKHARGIVASVRSRKK
jgi:hypothetical protein